MGLDEFFDDGVEYDYDIDDDFFEDLMLTKSLKLDLTNGSPLIVIIPFLSIITLIRYLLTIKKNSLLMSLPPLKLTA